jgi:hypothetical protein
VTGKDSYYFDLLKKKIVETMRETYPGICSDIADWKVQDISDFQEELLQKVNGSISEKWFYTHMKSTRPTLPRVDVLNLLSRYAGYANWDDFRFRNSDGSLIFAPVKKANRVFIIIPVVVVLITVVLFLLFKLFNTREYRFCFYDEYTRDSITGSVVEVTLLQDNESPVNYLCGPDGCFRLKTSRSRVRFVVRNPYYLTDTVTRILDKFNRDEQVGLRPNNYALMVRYFTGMNVTDWKKRREQLEQVIDDAAVIWQVFGNPQVGMAVYNKAEFIDLVTMPSGSLKNIEVLDSRVQGDRISLLRFRVRKEGGR